MRGDCEDNALEKRRILVQPGFPRAALRIANVFHREKMYAHAILTAETDAGILVLDQDHPEILPHQNTNYIFEKRERPDGLWEYFVQDW